MIGQNNLIAKIKSYSIATLPHSMLFIGEQGCGKHTLVSMLESIFNIESKDITKDISLDTIQNIYTCASPYFYVIDATKITEKQQNTVLKFLEEPSKNAYVILLATSKSTLLDTVINRCVTFEFEAYTKEDLVQFLSFDADVDKLLYYCHTPGQILKTSVETLDKVIELADNIIDNIRKARYSNVFRITDKLNVKDDSSKIDIYLFYTVLSERLLLRYIDNHDIVLYNMYMCLAESYKKYNTLRFNNECLIDSLLADMWTACKK